MVICPGILLCGAIVKVVGIILFFLTSATSWTQTPSDTTYQVELISTASPVVSFFREPRVPGTVNKPSLGYAIFVRGMWHPGRLLSVGLMTGYLVIAQDEIQVASLTKYSARLTAIPLQFAISMQKSGIDIGMGMGPYMMLSTIEGGNGAAAHGKRLELGLTFFGSYSFTLNETIKIGPEFRVLYFRYRGILSFMPAFSFRIDALRY